MCKQKETEQPSNIPSKIRSRRCIVVRDNKSGNIISAQLEEATEESSDVTSTKGYARLDPLEMMGLDPAYGKDSISIDEIDTRKTKK